MDGFDWDDANRDHIARHKVTTAEAEEALSGLFLDLASYELFGERRFESVAMTSRGRLLKIVTTHRHDLVRVVTALDATPALRKLYTAMVLEND